jgi:hypothetical protein
MADQDFEALRLKFDSFSLELKARIHEFERDGGFATTNASFTQRLLKDQASVEIELQAAMHQGSPWNATWIELERDVNALIGDFGALEQRLDAQMHKRDAGHAA